MDKLRNAIVESQYKNKDNRGRCFVSGPDIQGLLTRGAVREALYDKNASANCKLEPYLVDQAVEVVNNGAHRIFAILIHIRHTKSICHFFEHDRSQNLELDHALPFDQSTLYAILKDHTVAGEFYERQWHFAAPVFSDNIFTKVLPPETILPFTKDEIIGAGGFGDVYSIEIEPSHRRFLNRSMQQVEVG